MIYHDIGQYTVEWYSLRGGVATASQFHRIMTPSRRQLSSSRGDYGNELIAELLTGEVMQIPPKSYWQERGHEMEDAAAKLYEFETGEDLDRGGFFTTDDGFFGASPDRRLKKSGGIAEIKAPAPDTHIGYLLMNGELTDTYKTQAQGQLWVTGAPFVDMFSYHPQMPPAHIRTYRDEDFLADLEKCFEKFKEEQINKFDVLIAMGVMEDYPLPKKTPARKEMSDIMTAG